MENQFDPQIRIDDMVRVIEEEGTKFRNFCPETIVPLDQGDPGTYLETSMAATLLIGEALLTSGAAHYLVRQTLALLEGHFVPEPWLAVALAALFSSLAHILITSRTARASVLIPAVALPLSAFGADASALIFVTAVGSGFCQTLMVSAKPVVLFGSTEPPAFVQADLLRLAAYLLPIFIVLLIAFALFVWPHLGLPFETLPATPGRN
ncbi:hypothetical protein [Sinorhizobium meliloti]|uniref:hypothetical protein n=1 Tax=Rhizobium meliloti TaxID=382 RepID=UPI00037A04B7|nr:hypothetical protein [Sinorhizobium meliloti]